MRDSRRDGENWRTDLLQLVAFRYCIGGIKVWLLLHQICRIAGQSTGASKDSISYIQINPYNQVIRDIY